MRTAKLFVVSALLLPAAVSAQLPKPAPDPEPKAQSATMDKYPKFNDKEAAILWKRWIRKETFTQQDCARVIELCTVAYEYLNGELSEILNSDVSAERRRQLAANLQDTDKSGNMNTFTRSFSLRMQELAGNKQLDPEVMVKTRDMLIKKKENRKLVDQIFHAQTAKK